ncbi:hypothetical protein CapIbe_018358 [Capra ibex]
MLRTGPQGFLFGSFICLRGGQLAFPALAAEGEHLARNRGDCCEMSFTSQVTGTEVLSLSVLPFLQDFSSSQSSCGLVHFSSQAVTGAVSTIKFFFSEAFLGQHFQAVELEDNEPELGDLFLFRLMSPTGHWSGPTLVYTVAMERSSTLRARTLVATGLTCFSAPAKALYPNKGSPQCCAPACFGGCCMDAAALTT